MTGPGADLHAASLAALNLTGADLSGADLSSADLTTTNLTSANLTSANLTSATASNATLTSANLGKATLASAILGGANLTDAKLTAANLTNADLADSNLAGTTLTGATLTGASGVGIKGIPSALPANWSIRRGYLIGPGAGTLLTDANLSNVDLTGVDFSGLNLLRAIFQHANLTGANLTTANLTGVNFTDANLTRANLDGATVSSTNFTGTVWNSTTCPDGSNSNAHAHGWCFAPPPSSGFTAHRLQVPPGALANSFSPLTISCSSGTACFGGGTYVDPARGYLPAIWRWNGTQWSVSGTALPAGAATSRSAISPVASMSCPSSTRCFAGGNYRTGTGTNQGMLLKWAAWPLECGQGAATFQRRLQSVCDRGRDVVPVGDHVLRGRPVQRHRRRPGRAHPAVVGHHVEPERGAGTRRPPPRSPPLTRCRARRSPCASLVAGSTTHPRSNSCFCCGGRAARGRS